MTTSTLAVQLPVEQQLRVTECLGDLAADRLFREVTEGLLTTQELRRAIDPETTGLVARLGEESVRRWRRLSSAALFIASLGDRLSDGLIEAALSAGASADPSGVLSFRHRAQQEGGPAAFVQARLSLVPANFTAQLDRTTGEYRAIAETPDPTGVGQPPRAAANVSDEQLACAIGIADVAVGGIGLGVALAAEVFSGGVSTPLSVALAGTSATVAGYGAGLASAAC